ncbi:hypothetical protein B0T26DRAFT_740805 [Lasiosphaeria miniovina]|uniref:Nucleotide-diphospho-sugar transferase domain-containing protein n=1 Tax=Lasiosphaeria miniovina TaxID=1954250 RepID=A0AA40AKE8_9PEZI|nr:uncharacterized protein B0T26DRAFT_740805 [Lasiosphaeria miniovina]KAK0717390.1 hypothetical protein B0T26DRAFT_740805 [Lasiosphaeria miniovina]
MLSAASQRIAIFCIPAAFLVATFTFSTLYTGSATAPFRAIAGSTKTSPPKDHSTFADIVAELYRPIKVPVDANNYTDQRGKVFENGGRSHWTQGLGKNIVIVDIDTRVPDGPNEIFNPQKIDWATGSSNSGGVLTASLVNHYMYSQIHGYEYKYFHARRIDGLWDTWIKPHVLKEMLELYRFVVFIDADAIIQHLEVPMEFLFNRWNIAPNTSIAMPIDTRQGNEGMSMDSKGKVVLNTGVVVAQSSRHTFDMMDAWRTCTDETRYPGCGKWKTKWSHEQRAFSEFIRYDFNPDGDNIVEINCNDANGYPGLFGKADVIDDCQGEFVRHYTLDKGMARASVTEAIAQTISEVVQRNLLKTREWFFIEEG